MSDETNAESDGTGVSEKKSKKTSKKNIKKKEESEIRVARALIACSNCNQGNTVPIYDNTVDKATCQNCKQVNIIKKETLAQLK